MKKLIITSLIVILINSLWSCKSSRKLRVTEKTCYEYAIPTEKSFVCRNSREIEMVYFISFSDGSVEKVSTQQYYKYSVGKSYYVTKSVKKTNPKYKK